MVAVMMGLHRGKRVAIVWVTRQRCDMGHELAAIARLSGVATETLTPNSYGRCALPLPMHSTSGACSTDLAPALAAVLIEHMQYPILSADFFLAMVAWADQRNEPARTLSAGL
jgi:hypothetical protein